MCLCVCFGVFVFGVSVRECFYLSVLRSCMCVSMLIFLNISVCICVLVYVSFSVSTFVCLLTCFYDYEGWCKSVYEGWLCVNLFLCMLVCIYTYMCVCMCFVCVFECISFFLVSIFNIGTWYKAAGSISS